MSKADIALIIGAVCLGYLFGALLAFIVPESASRRRDRVDRILRSYEEPTWKSEHKP